MKRSRPSLNNNNNEHIDELADVKKSTIKRTLPVDHVKEEEGELPVADIIRSFKYTAECLNMKHPEPVYPKPKVQQQQQQQQECMKWNSSSHSVTSSTLPSNYLSNIPMSQSNIYVPGNIPNSQPNSYTPSTLPNSNSYSANSSPPLCLPKIKTKSEIRKATVKQSDSDALWDILQTELRKKYHNAILKKIRYTDSDNDEISIYENSELVDAIFNEGITKFCLFYEIFEVTYVARSTAVLSKKETNDFFGTRKCYPSPRNSFTSKSASAWDIFSSSIKDVSLGARIKYILYTDKQGNGITIASPEELDYSIFVEGICKFCICFTIVTSNNSARQ